MKAQQRDTMEETNDDRNGIVVSKPIGTRERYRVHGIDSTRGIPNKLVEKRCSKSQFGNSCEK